MKNHSCKLARPALACAKWSSQQPLLLLSAKGYQEELVTEACMCVCIEQGVAG